MGRTTNARRRKPGRRARVLLEAVEPRRLLAANLVISEFLASNTTSITDNLGNHEDWIEIHNAGDAPANLNDYFLTDDAGNPEQWRFPVQSLAANGYLIVFASNRNLAVAGQELHTNFKLSSSGEYLALIRAADDTPQFEYAPTFPAQSQDVSYGLFDANDANSSRLYLTTLTPGAQNSPAAAAATYSVAGKVFTGTLAVSLSDTTPGAVIHYTIDGTMPTASSPTYASAFSLTNTTMLRTIVTAPGYASSPVASQSYIALSTATTMTDPNNSSTVNVSTNLGVSTLPSFSSNLPIVLINSFNSTSSSTSYTTISQTTFTGAIASFIDTTNGVANITDTPNYMGRAGIHVRGSTSSGYAKKQFSVELWDENNNDKKASLLGMPSESDWVLYAPYTEKALMQDTLGFKWANEMGHYASRTRYVELFMSTQNAVTPLGASPYLGGTAPPTTGTTYIGVYILQEKIKVDNNRVDIEEISPTNLNGGWIVAQDRNDSGAESSFVSSGWGVQIVNVAPDVDTITPAVKSAISSRWNQFDNALKTGDYTNASSPDYYGNYIDVRSFVDYYLLNEMMRNIDAFWLSTYYTKQADTVVNGSVTQYGLISIGPVWDFNLSLGMANYNFSANAAGWNTDRLSPKITNTGTFANKDPYFQQLLKDSNFNQAVSDRWAELRASFFSTSALNAEIDANVSVLANGTTNYPIGTVPTQAATNPVVRNFIRWQILGVGAVTEGLYDPAGNWTQEINLAKNWLTARVNWMDSQYIPKPTVTPGGNFGSPVTVTMTPKGAASTADTTVLAPGATTTYTVPTNFTGLAGWWATTYTPSGWSTGTFGLGYDTTTSGNTQNYTSLITTNLAGAMNGATKRPSVLTRTTFNITDPSSVGALILKVKYDDGFVAWILSSTVGSEAWNSRDLKSRPH